MDTIVKYVTRELCLDIEVIPRKYIEIGCDNIFLYLQLIIFESINVSFEKFISMLQSTCTLTFKLRGRWSKKYDGHRKLTSEFPAAKIWHSISH